MRLHFIIPAFFTFSNILINLEFRIFNYDCRIDKEIKFCIQDILFYSSYLYKRAKTNWYSNSISRY